MPKYSFTVSLVLFPLTFILSTIWPDLLSMTVSFTSFPLAFIFCSIFKFKFSSFFALGEVLFGVTWLRFIPVIFFVALVKLSIHVVSIPRGSSTVDDAAHHSSAAIVLWWVLILLVIVLVLVVHLFIFKLHQSLRNRVWSLLNMIIVSIVSYHSLWLFNIRPFVISDHIIFSFKCLESFC